MDKLTVSLEVACKLKEAGLKGRPALAWLQDNEAGAYYTAPYPDNVILFQFNSVISAPTASEIAEVLHEKHDLWCVSQMGNPRWRASDTVNENLRAYGDTMADALALLWIKLQEEK